MPEIYIHRSGRIGRAGKSGISIAIIHTREIHKIKEIEKLAGISFTKELIPSGKDICQKQLYSLMDKIKKVDVDESQIEPFLPTIYEKFETLGREELIKHFVSAEFNRFLSYYKNARDINLTENKSKKQKAKREKISHKERRRSNFESFFINVGSIHNMNPSRLMGIINEGLNSGDAMIGRIEIMKKFSFFEIEESRKKQIIKALNGKQVGGTRLSIEVAKDKPTPDSQYSKSKSFRPKNRSRKDERKRSKHKEKVGNQRKHRK